MLQGFDPTVFVVDDDDQVRGLVERLVLTIGARAESYADARDFLAAHEPGRSGCLVSDVRMPHMTGLELQEALAAQQSPLPVILLTAHADVPMVVQAMKSNVVDVVEKPFRNQDLLERIQRALHLDRDRREELLRRAEVEALLSHLSVREREVMDLVVAGLANKQIAQKLELSEKTIEAHRSHVMKKLGVGSVAELVRLVVTSPRVHKP